MTETTRRTDRWLTLSARLSVVWLIGAAIGCSAHATNRTSTMTAPLVIQEQGSFAVGGTVVTAPGTVDPIAQGAFNPAGPDPRGQTLHGDHAYVFYQVPANARRLPRQAIIATTFLTGLTERATGFEPVTSSLGSWHSTLACSSRATRRR